MTKPARLRYLRRMRPLCVLALLLAGSAFAEPPPPGVDMKKVSSHLLQHQSYPATRAELITSCFNLEDFSAVEKKWFIASVPNRKFKSADEVVAAITK